MFDFSQVQRADAKIALGVAVGAGAVWFVTSGNGFAGRFLWAAATAAIAALTATLFLALD